MSSLRRHIAKKTTLDDNRETAMVFYQFRKLPSTCQELVDLLKCVEAFGKTDIAEQLKYLFSDRLLILFVKRIVVDATEVDDRILRTQMLLEDTLDYCLDADPAAKDTTSSFFSKLMKKLDKKLKKEEPTWDDMRKILMKFVLKEFSLDLDKTKADKINRKQILFILHHVPDASPALLNMLLQWSVDNGDEEMVSCVQQVFDGRHWKPMWNTLRSIGPKEEVNRIESALSWKYCRLSSYQQKMQICSNLQEKLGSDSEELRKWIEKQETEITGIRFDDEDTNQLKSSFLDFFRQLSNEITQGSSKSRWMKIKESANQKMLGRTSEKILIIQQKMRRALFLYDQVPFDQMDEIKELYQLLQDADADVMKASQNIKESDGLFFLKDWSDLKMTHYQNWTTNYIRHWAERHQMHLKEIARFKTDIQDGKCWPQSSRMAVHILLNKYLCFTSQNLSPVQSLGDWKSLAEMGISELDKLREEIQKRTSDNHFDGNELTIR